MRISRLLLAASLFTSACSADTDGPTPVVASVSPDVVCAAQSDVTLTIDGSGFSPLVHGGLTDDPAVIMPEVYLVGPADSVYQIPPDNVSLGDRTGTQLVVVLPAGAVSPTGPGQAEVTYGIRVVNPNGNEGTLGDAVTVVPPPELLAVNPNLGAQDTLVSITLTGTGFRDGMTVTLESSPPVDCTNVVVLDATTATCDLDLTGVAAGTYGMTVANDVGCSDTLPDAFTVYEPHRFALTGIDPPFGCTCSDTTVTIFSDGEFVSTPRVEMRPHGESGPVVAFERVAFIDANTLTAIVPAGADLGEYDVTVLNPPSDGGIGSLDNGFRVVADPIPSIEAVVPARGDPSGDTDVWIYGESFRNEAQVEMIDIDGNVVATVGPIAIDPSPTTAFQATLPTTGMTEGPYLIRVTDLDQDTYSTWSAFLVAAIGPSGNLHPFGSEEPLNTGRRMLAGVSARDDDGNRYLYAIGGDTGATGSVLDSVEVTQLSRFGQLGSWDEIRNPLTTPRVGAAAVAVPIFDPDGSPFVPIKTYLYVLGGQSDAGEVLSSIERAVVLSTSDAPVITDAAASATAGTLDAGTWYYKVAAVLDDGDPDNPGGETVASDEAIVTLGVDGAIDLSWDPVTTNGLAAQSYRIYRTDAVDGASQTEHLIATTEDTSFTDTGEEPGTEQPLPAGATGVWVEDPAVLGDGTTPLPRWGHGAALVTDALGDRYVYVVGGKSDLTTGYLGEVAHVAVDDTDGSLGDFSTAGTNTLAIPRAFFGLAVETPENVSGLASGARLFAIGGVEAGGGGGDASTSIEMSEVSDGGGNGAWAEQTTGPGNLGARAGVMAAITGEKLFAVGGGGGATSTAVSNITNSGRDVPFDSSGDINPPFQSTAEGLLGPRALGVVLRGSGFLYFLGGSSTGDDALETVERTF